MGVLKKKKAEKRSTRPTFKGILTAVLATKAAIFLLLLAGLSLSGAAMAMVVSMPLFIVFSPILVPAGLTTGLVVTALAAGGGSGMSALTIILWLYKKLTGKEPPKIPGVKPPGGASGDNQGDNQGDKKGDKQGDKKGDKS
ncbi:hypothetical protein AALP_AA5G122400 [Arabis alpina]|uniref:Oleosin n=1 Tax=Arabis alpina TaxID=50452 RepID=A0A087GWL2_ARAAL|nr:hypothetical protein AALP_AA5G122400 [Arabis alpina]